MMADYQLNKQEQMNKYLDSLKIEATQINGDESIIWLAKDFLDLLINKLAKRNLILEIPDCCPNNSSDNFYIMFTWDKDEDYLECEIFNSGVIEFFYRNRYTHKVWSWECNFTMRNEFEDGIEELLEKISLFVE